jgi:hypothetical protein
MRRELGIDRGMDAGVGAATAKSLWRVVIWDLNLGRKELERELHRINLCRIHLIYAP